MILPVTVSARNACIFPLCVNIVAELTVSLADTCRASIRVLVPNDMALLGCSSALSSLYLVGMNWPDAISVFMVSTSDTTFSIS